jgi:hypothetical protein
MKNTNAAIIIFGSFSFFVSNSIYIPSVVSQVQDCLFFILFTNSARLQFCHPIESSLIFLHEKVSNESTVG